MRIEDSKEIQKRLLQLAKQKATGKPAQLASKLGISERSVYRLRDSLQANGQPIRYSRICQSYILD